MSDELRVALAFGILLAAAYLVIRALRSEGIRGSDVAEAVGLAFTPFFIPGAIEMIVKAFGRDALPVFNAPEDRVALTVGGGILIAAFLYGNYIAIRRAWTNQR